MFFNQFEVHLFRARSLLRPSSPRSNHPWKVIQGVAPLLVPHCTTLAQVRQKEEPPYIQYVQGCVECQHHKVNTQPTKALLAPIFPEPKANPFKVIALDFITKLPKSQKYDSILAITDHDCFKASLFIPCTEDITAERVAELFVQRVFQYYGLPQKIISDRDPRFTSKFARKLCCLLGIKQNVSTAYHPRMYRQSEQTNQWLETYLQFFVNYQQDDWTVYLPLAEFAHNN